MLGSRVKSIWQTRIGRSRSRENASQDEAEAQDANTPVELEQDHRVSVIDSKAAATPHTPAIDADFYKYSMDDSVYVSKAMSLDDVTPVSPSTSSTTSGSTNESPLSTAEKLSEKASANPVTSMFRTFSEARMFPSMNKSKPPPVPASAPASDDDDQPTTAPSSSSTRFSFAPPIPTPWRTSRSSSDCAPNTSSSASSSSTFSFSSASASALPPREAALNALNNVHNVSARCRTALSSSISRGSPYGELVVVDILEARGLAADQDERGVDLPFTASLQLGDMNRKSKPADRENLAVNERFVFWLPSSPTIGQRTLDVFVLGGDERDLGELHLSLSMPVNETFADWFPIVSRVDGLKHGSVRVAMRRQVLTSSPMVEAAQSLGERDSCLNFSDSTRYGDLLPELWSCFPGSEPEVAASSPPKEGSKLGRLIGIQEQVQRDVF